jgi:hypothetical protein
LQFGEWLRADILAGSFEPATTDPDLAILLAKARQVSIALVGPPAEQLFDPVPDGDFFKVLADTLKLWNSPENWAGDERNVVLTFARIWYSAATGGIVPKDAPSCGCLLGGRPARPSSVLSTLCWRYSPVRRLAGSKERPEREAIFLLC